MKSLLLALSFVLSTAFSHAFCLPGDMPPSVTNLSGNVSAFRTRPVLYLNEAVTTHLVLPEHIKLVDLSTEKIAGNQCSDNIVRLKPSCPLSDGAFVGTVTLIGERHIALYDLIYTADPRQALPLFYVPGKHLHGYQNPAVKMSGNAMAQYAWAIFCSGRRYHDIKTKAYGISMRINNIYAVDDYFFIDFSLHNHTHIPYDIEELRVKLMDKKETKATNSQTLDLTPDYLLFDAKTFRKDYRNVLVLKKMTFPEEKILQLEVYESQISGRTLSLPITYENILHADALSEDIITHLPIR